MKSLGNHLLIELYKCDNRIIGSIQDVERILLSGVEISGAQIVKPVFHRFKPHGVSGVVVIAESHFSIHTWPEYGYCALDIFTCGDEIDNDSALKYISTEFGAESFSVVEMKRGVLSCEGGDLPHKPQAARGKID